VNHTLDLLADPDAATREAILGGLIAFNQTFLVPGLEIQNLAVGIRDASSQEIVGGLWGRTGWEWLTVELVFVPESLRRQGIASRLLGIAEDEARRRGCHSAWLDTLNVEALNLYERLGYRRFGELKDFPAGQNRYFLQKRLTPAA
jgi:ribosomal protein S18 acetylase RimI-like enzyme